MRNEKKCSISSILFIFFFLYFSLARSFRGSLIVKFTVLIFSFLARLSWGHVVLRIRVQIQSIYPQASKSLASFCSETHSETARKRGDHLNCTKYRLGPTIIFMLWWLSGCGTLIITSIMQKNGMSVKFCFFIIWASHLFPFSFWIFSRAF